MKQSINKKERYKMKKSINYIKYLKRALVSLVLLSVPYVLATAITTEQLQKAEIINVDGLTVKATFTNLSGKAIKQGLNKVYLEGKIEEKGTSNLGISTISINWVRLADKVSDNKVYLDTPLQTIDLKVKPALEEGDTLFVKGDIDNLVSKQQELIIKNSEDSSKEEDDEKVDEKDKSESKAVNQSTGYVPTSSNSSKDDDKNAFDSEITGQSSVIVTSDGCDIISNIPALEANQYKKIIENGEVIQDCSASEEVYALTKDYNTCSPMENLSELSASQRYTLGYVKKEGDTRTVINGGYCYIDETTTVDIIEKECGNEIDLDDAKYYKKSNFTYSLNGRSYVAQDCVRIEDTALDMQKDTSTCSASFLGGYYTPFFNWFVKEKGSYIGLSECLPDVDKKITLEEEICTGENKYTYDSDNNRAYLNKTYFYKKDDERIVVTDCGASDISYTYKVEIDNNICPFINNDETKETTQRGYQYFNGLDDERVDIQNRCVSIYPAIPYEKVNNIWVTSKTEKTEIGNNDDMQDLKTSYANQTSNGALSIATYWNNKGTHPCFSADYSFGAEDSDTKYTCIDYTTSSTAEFKKYCLHGLSEPYTIDSVNSTVDVENSTTIPTYEELGVNAIAYWWGSNKYAYHNQKNIKFECSVPSCDLSTVEARPAYKRGDGTEFVDLAVTYGTKYVCGNEKIEGTIAK